MTNDTELEYDMLVQRDKNTCMACPTQWEGTLWDGRVFYFRYRWGHAYLGVAPAGGDPIFAGGSPGGKEAMLGIGGALDGYLLDNEYREVFVKLYHALS